MRRQRTRVRFPAPPLGRRVLAESARRLVSDHVGGPSPPNPHGAVASCPSVLGSSPSGFGLWLLGLRPCSRLAASRPSVSPGSGLAAFGFSGLVALCLTAICLLGLAARGSQFPGSRVSGAPALPGLRASRLSVLRLPASRAPRLSAAPASQLSGSWLSASRPSAAPASLPSPAALPAWCAWPVRPPRPGLPGLASPAWPPRPGLACPAWPAPARGFRCLRSRRAWASRLSGSSGSWLRPHGRRPPRLPASSGSRLAASRARGFRCLRLCRASGPLGLSGLVALCLADVASRPHGPPASPGLRASRLSDGSLLRGRLAPRPPWSPWPVRPPRQPCLPGVPGLPGLPGFSGPA